MSSSGASGYALIVESVNTVAASGSAQTIPAPATATINLVTLTAACTFTFPAAVAGSSFLLLLKQGTGGGFTASWPGTVKWPGGTAPTLTTAAAKTDVLSFLCPDGAEWLGVAAAQNY